METKEIYLLTAFVCAACDGDIAPEEISLVKTLCNKSDLFIGLDVEALLNKYVASINQHGIHFINDFLSLLENTALANEEQLEVIKLAIDVIEADRQVLYSEIKFFKKLRPCLNISDEEILAAMPDKEDYLLPDIKINDFAFNNSVRFADIDLKAMLP